MTNGNSGSHIPQGAQTSFDFWGWLLGGKQVQ